MADTRFFVGGDGIFETNANWTGAAHPIAGDSIVLDGRTAINLTDDNHTSAAETMVDAVIEPQYTGMIGTSGAPLTLSTATLQMRAPGTLWFENGSAAVTPRVVINNPSCTAHIGCSDNDIINVIEALRGDVQLTATLTGLLELVVGDSNVTIVGANTIALVKMIGSGNVTCLPTVTLLENLGTGTFTQLPLAVGAVTSMRIGSGARVVYQSANNITLAQIHDGGSLDVTGARSVLTIAELWKGQRATFRQAGTTIVTVEYPL